MASLPAIALLTLPLQASGAGKHPVPACLPIIELTQPPATETQPSSTQLAIAPQTNHDTCIRAHIYQVIELTDGTRFLDVCPTETPDNDCRFILMSLSEDRDEVGDLRKFRDREVEVRGILRPLHGRLGILISHARQFEGGTEKFRPNPKLLQGFNGQSDHLPVHDPNLSTTGHHRSFMSRRDRETLPAAKP